MTNMTLTTLFMLIMLFSISLIVLNYLRARNLAQRWALAQGYELVSAEQRLMMRGPFWLSARGQIIFRITVRDAAGSQRQGWLRCGSAWLGIFADKVEVRWDDEA